MAKERIGTLSFSSLDSELGLAVFDKFDFGMVDSVDTVAGTMIVELPGPLRRSKLTPPIFINWQYGYAVKDEKFDRAFQYGCRVMPVKGMIVLLYRSGSTWIHLGSIYPALSTITQELRRPIDDLESAVVPHIQEGEVSLESSTDLIHLQRGRGILLESAEDLRVFLETQFKRYIVSAINHRISTESDRTRLILGKVLRANQFEPIPIEQYDSRQSNAFTFDEHHLILNQPTISGKLDETSDPEYELFIAPVLVEKDFKTLMSEFPEEKKSSLFTSSKNLIYFEKFSHDEGRYALPTVTRRNAEIKTEIAEDGEYCKEISFGITSTKKVTLKVEKDTTTTFENDKASCVFKGTGDITTKNEKATIEALNSGDTTIKNEKATIEALNTGDITVTNTGGANLEVLNNGDIIISNSAGAIIKASSSGKITIENSQGVNNLKAILDQVLTSLQNLQTPGNLVSGAPGAPVVAAIPSGVDLPKTIADKIKLGLLME